METSNKTGRIIGTLLIGAAIGGTLGILFAPDKGSRTRRRILSKGEDLSDDLKDKFNDFLEETKKEMVSAKNKANDFMNDGISKVEKLKAS